MGDRRIFIPQGGDSFPISFSATSTWAEPQYTTIEGAAYNPVDGYLYTLEFDFDIQGAHLVKRNATTLSYISATGQIPGGIRSYGLGIDSTGYVWMINRSTDSKLRKYDTSATYQNTEFSVTGYYANSVVCDHNDTFWVTRASSQTVYGYNTSGTNVKNVTITSTAANQDNLINGDGGLWKSNSERVYGYDTAAESNIGYVDLPNINYRIDGSGDFSATTGYFYITQRVANNSQVALYTANF